MLMAFGRRGVLGGWLEGLGIVIPFTTVFALFAQTTGLDVVAPQRQ